MSYWTHPMSVQEVAHRGSLKQDHIVSQPCRPSHCLPSANKERIPSMHFLVQNHREDLDGWVLWSSPPNGQCTPTHRLDLGVLVLKAIQDHKVVQRRGDI